MGGRVGDGGGLCVVEIWIKSNCWGEKTQYVFAPLRLEETWNNAYAGSICVVIGPFQGFFVLEEKVNGAWLDKHSNISTAWLTTAPVFKTREAGYTTV